MATKSALIFSFIFISVIAQKPTNNLRCYVCESENTKGCDDPMDKSLIPSVDCSSLVYPFPKEGDERIVVNDVLSNSVDGKFQGSPIIGEVFQGSAVGERALLPFKYICLKVTFTADGKTGTTRTCEKVTESIKDTCDFLKHEVNPRIKVVSCGSCDKDNCNSEAFPNNNSNCDSDDCSSATYLNMSVLGILIAIAFFVV